MAILASKTALGASLGDTFGRQYVARIWSDGVYGFADLAHDEFTVVLGGQFLLDPNEINTWGPFGPIDNTNTQDAGNVGSATWNRLVGGIKHPWPVRVKRMSIDHYNSNLNVLPWGWVIAWHTKTGGTNTVSPVTYLLDEVADNGGAGPRDYGNTTNQVTQVDLPDTAIVPAEAVLSVGVAAPTAVTTNYYVRILSGYLLCQRVDGVPPGGGFSVGGGGTVVGPPV